MKRFVIALLFTLAALAFATDTVWFVGGPDGHANTSTANAGGCTLDHWVNVAQGDISLIMDDGGAPVCYDDDAGIFPVPSFPTVIYLTTPPPSDDCWNGMYVNIIDADVAGDEGRYLILDTYSTGSYIFVAEDHGLTTQENGVEISIGGALPTLEDAVETPIVPTCSATSSGDSRYILTCRDETIGSSVDLTIGGDKDMNNWVHIIGYKEAPPSNQSMTNGDMDPGGMYYGGAIENYKDAEDGFSTTADWVRLTTNYDDDDLISLELAKENIHFRNIQFMSLHSPYTYRNCIGSNEAGADQSVYYNIVATNCSFKLSGQYIAPLLDFQYIAFNDCYFDDTVDNDYLVDASLFTPGVFRGCVFYCTGSRTGAIEGIDDEVCVNGCVILDADTAIKLEEGVLALSNSVFYGVGDECILTTNGNSRCYGSDNIFYLAATDDYAVQVGDSDGTVMLRNSCVYSASGPVTNEMYYDDLSSGVPLIDSIALDPQFRNAVNLDFSLKSSSPCIGAGTPTIGGGETTIGAWQPEGGGGTRWRTRP